MMDMDYYAYHNSPYQVAMEVPVMEDDQLTPSVRQK